MSIVVNVNGKSINYPQAGDINWEDEATDFAVQTSSALAKVGLSTGTTVDLPGTLDVTGNTTLDANLSVGGNASVTGNTALTGNITVNGNSNLGNGTSDTTSITGILNVNSGVLYVNPTNSKVGINDATPSVELDVNGAVAITGNETVGGTLDVTGATSLSSTLAVTGDVAVNTNKFNVTASNGNTTIAGALGIANGTASAPSLTPSGDTNTGLYSIGSDIIGFSSNGVRVGEFGNGYGGFTGNIIQVVQTSIDTQLSTSSTSYVDVTGLFLTITPKYTSSKIYIKYKINGSNTSNGALNSYQILRNSTIVGNGNQGSRRLSNSSVRGCASDANSNFIVYGEFIDSPLSVSSITYKIQWIVDSGTGYINRDPTNSNTTAHPSPLSIITAMEIQQ